MKIFGYEIKKTQAQVQNVDVKRPNRSDIYNNFVTVKAQIMRSSKDIGDFKAAVISAENWLNPQRYLLYEVYKNIIIDSHLTACIEQRKNLTLSKDFCVVNAEGEKDEEKTKLIKATWFRSFLDLSLESKVWGHSLIQFNDVVRDQFTSIELIPRQYVKPELHIVTQDWTGTTGNDYLAEPFKNWCISVGESHDLGLLMKAAPLIIWKQAALGAWAEYQEVFGSPIRYLKTNVLDAATKQSGIDMMENMGASAWAVIDTNDELVISEQSKSDAHKVFDEMIQRVNSEIAKLILGQTGTTDEKAHVGSAEVHERILAAIAESDEHFIESILNDKLVPFMRNLGIDIGEGNRIKASEDEELTVKEKSTILIELLKTGKYHVDPEYIKYQFGIEVEEVEEEENEPTEIEKKLKNYYS